MSLLEVKFSMLLDAAEQADSEVPNQGPEDLQRLQHVVFSVGFSAHRQVPEDVAGREGP